MRIHRRTDLTLDGLTRWLNPIVRGWMTYYGRFYRSEMAPLLQRLNTYLRRWAAELPPLPQVVERADRETTRSVRPVEVDPRVLNVDERSPVKGDFHAGI
ncbi:MAG: group II intron maturase-specific domain-containing protein [Acidimicrobiales bacterium]